MSASAASRANSAPARRVHQEVLPSGPTLLVREVHVAPVAEVQVWVRVGSADERDHERGLAHFHEHMLFKGTERRGVGEVAGEIEGVGGRINAYTSYDVTVYHATVPAAEVGTAIDVLADAVQYSIFDPEEVTREKEVVLEEIRRSEDAPYHVLSDAVFETAYDVHPYREPILGSSESVSSFDSEKVRAFFERWYTAENFVVVVTGDVDTAEIRQQVDTAFSEARRGGAQRGRPDEPAVTGRRSQVLKRPFERACLEVSWPGVPFAHPDAPLLDLLAFILGDGESSRLTQQVKEHEAVVDRIDASSYTPLDAGLFGASADLDPEHFLDALTSIAREVELLRLSPVDAKELDKARANFLASEQWERESVSGVARKAGSFFVVAGDAEGDRAYLERIAAATAEDLLRVARAWLEPERAVVCAVLPEEGEAPSHEEILAALDRGTEAARRRFARPARTGTQREIVSYELDEGAHLHVVNRPDVPVVSARAAMLGGSLHETPETAGVHSFLAGLWLRGTRTRSAAELARDIESLAGDLDGFSGRSSIGLTFDTTSDRLLPMLDLFGEVLREPALDPTEIEIERRDTLASLERRQDQLGACAFDLFAETHFREHPYRIPIPGTEASVRAIDREILLAHQHRIVRPENLEIALVGDVDPDEVAAEIASRLAGLAEDTTEAATTPPIEPEPDEIREATRTRDRAQAHLVIGFRGLDVADPDRHALEVLVQVLSGQGGSLFLELRDRRSLAYTVSATNVEGLAPGFFAVYIATAPEKLEAARTGLLEQLERAIQEAPGAHDLERAQRYLVGNFAIDEQRSATRAAHMALDARYGLGPDADRNYADAVQAITADDVLRVARRIVKLDAYTLAAVRPPD